NDTVALLDRLLEAARLGIVDEPNVPATFALRKLLDKIVSHFGVEAQAKNLVLRLHCPSELTLTTDFVKLDRVITNLVGNAVKFTSTGSVTLEVEHGRTGVEIHVIDTGPGIADEHKEHLFDEFFQIQNHERDRKKGFGLGLAIARRLARQLGGDVAVES